MSSEALSTPDPTTKEVAALKALARGEARPEEQKAALAFIVEKICRSADLTWLPDSERASSFLAGRSFAGKRVLFYINTPMERLFPDDIPK